MVIDDHYLPIQPIQQYLRFLEDCHKSPLTLRTYAYHLKIYWEYIEQVKIKWKEIDIDVIGNFVVYLKGGDSGNVIHLQKRESIRADRSINQIVIAIASFYDYHHRVGNVKELPIYFSRRLYGVNNRFKPLLHHITKYKPVKNSLFRLKEKKSIVKVVEPIVIKKAIDSCKYQRDKFLIALLYETGCRIGQALGLKHEDIESYNNTIHIVPREDNLNYARAKTRDAYTIHVSKDLMALYFSYFMEEYGDIESDYVFVNIWGGAMGQPVSYNTVIALFNQISKKINAPIRPHMLRHTHATELLKDGWDMAHIQKRLGHKNIQTTMNIYTHLTDSDHKKYYQDYIERRKQK